MKHLTNDVLCLVAAGRQVAQEQAAFARKMADIAITLQREICCLRRQATEIYSAQDRQIRTYRPSPEVLENLQRYERCGELRQSLLGRHDGSNAVEECVLPARLRDAG